eukprot:gene47445-50309_t
MAARRPAAPALLPLLLPQGAVPLTHALTLRAADDAAPPYAADTAGGPQQQEEEGVAPPAALTRLGK